MATDLKSGTVHADTMKRALEFAGLRWGKLHLGTHPDDGGPCMWLEADIRQYSALLVGLAVQQRTAAALSFLADRVQLQHDSNGDTRFWLPGLEIQD